METAGVAEGCSACGVGPFKNKQEELWHAVSLQHHRNVDAASHDWFHICDLCKVKVGPLQNYIDHVGGRKHQNALGMYQRTQSSEGKKKQQQPNLKQKKVKLTVKGNAKRPLKGGTTKKKVKSKEQKANSKQAKQTSSGVKKKSPNNNTPKKQPPSEVQTNGAGQTKKSTSSHNSDNSSSREEEVLEKVEPEDKPKKKPVTDPPSSSSKPAVVKKVKKPLVKAPSVSKPVAAAKPPKKSPVDPPGKPVAVKQLKKPLAHPPSDGETVVKRAKKLPAEPPSTNKLLGEEGVPERPPVDSSDSGGPVTATEQPTGEPDKCDSLSQENNLSVPSEAGGGGDDVMYGGNWGNSHGNYPARPNGRGAPFMNYRGGRGHGPWHGGGPPFQPPFNPYGGPRPFNRFARGGGVPPWALNPYVFNLHANGGGHDGAWHRDSYDDDRWQFTSAGHGYGERDRDDRPRESSSRAEAGAVDRSDEVPPHQPSRPNSSSSADGHRGESARPASPTSSTKSQRSDRSSVGTSTSVGSANGRATGRQKSETGEKGSSLTRARPAVKGDSAKEKNPAASAGKRPLLPCPPSGGSSDTGKTARAVAEKRKVSTSPCEKSGASRERDQRTRVLTTVSVSPGVAKQRQSVAAREAATGSPPVDRAKTKVAIKKEMVEGAEDTAEGAVSASSKGSHLIFLSSEDEDHDVDGKSAASKHKSSKSEGGATTAKKPVKKTKSGGPVGTPSTPERDAALSKSPRVGSTSTKDMYRRDVLDKLVNFPSSRQVQTQLNKWMMEMQKHQKSVSWRQTLRLCTTQARLEQEEDPLSAVPNVDFDVLVRQVEACELPEEMLRSLMQALSAADVAATEERAPLAPSAASVAVASPTSGPSVAKKTASSGGTAKASEKAPPSSAAQAKSLETGAIASSNDEDEIMVLPTPPKVVVSVNLVDSEEEEEEEEGSMDEEDAKPSTTTPAASRLAKEQNTDSQQTASANNEETQPTQSQPGRQRPPSRESRHRHSVCSGANSSDDESRPTNRSIEREAAKSVPGDADRPASRAKSATPTGGAAFASAAAASAAASSSAPPAGHNLHLPSLMTPPPLVVLPKPPVEQPPAAALAAQLLSSPAPPPPLMVVTKVEPPSSPQAHQGRALDDLSAAEPARGMTATAGCPPPPNAEGGARLEGSATTPPIQLRGLVDELSVRCQQEDTIRQQLVELERSITSTLATLEELRRRKDELLAREAQVRKERLDILQCLQGVTSTVPAGATLLTPPRQKVPGADMPPSFNLGSGEVLFKVSQGAPPTVAGQVPGGGGVGLPQSSSANPTAQDIAQLLLPHLRQFGDIDLNSLAAHNPVASSSSSTSAMPTMSPEVSRGPSATKKATPKRKARDGEGTAATRKRQRAADAEIDELRLEEIPPCQEISAHDLAVVALKLHGHFVYSSSNDCSARRHDLLDPSQCVKYLGSTKTVNSLEVYSTKGRAAVLYTTSLDGLLRSYDPETGDCTDSFDVQAPVVCSALAWGKVYLGLQTGHITVFNVKTRKLQDSFYCSNTPVNCMTTTTEGAQKLLCTVSLDGSVTVRDPSTGLLFRCLDGCVQPPCCILVNNGSVYTTSTDRTIRLHELRTGCLQKVYDCKSAATGIQFQKGFIICCSFDGLIRFYRVKDFSCEMVYYGAGKNMVTSMDVSGPLIATGNRKGKLEVIKIDKSHLQVCEIRGCNLRFAREEDLLQHLKREHIGLGGAAAAAGSRAAGGSGGGGGSMTCPWTQCQMSFTGPHCAKDFEKHLMDHACT